MREDTCCFTGHRIIAKDELPIVRKKLAEKIEMLIKKGVVNFGTGGALGFDTECANAVLKLRVKYPKIRLFLILPCKDQTSKWSEKSKKEYDRIRSLANGEIFTSERYITGCMHKRNRHMVDNSGYMICYLRRETGGTKYTFDYAIEQGTEIIMI